MLFFFSFFQSTKNDEFAVPDWLFMLETKVNIEGFVWSHRGKTGASISERICTAMSDFGVFGLQVGP